MPHTLARRPLLSAPFLCLLLLAGCRGTERGGETGLRVDEVGAGGAAETAGLRVGDIVLGWERQRPDGSVARRGRLLDPFELAEVEAEEGPRGRVVLQGRRQHEAVTWTLPPGEWKITPQPRLTGSELSRYQAARGQRAATDGSYADAIESLAAGLRSRGAWGEACWLELLAGDARAQARQWRQAQAVFERARASARDARSGLIEARGWEAEGASALRTNDLAGAEAAYGQALRLREQLAGKDETLMLALAQARLAHVAFNRRDLSTAEDLWSRALRTRERHAPLSLPAASTLNGLGAVQTSRGDLAAAAAFYQRALAVREALAPGGLDHARTVINLGTLARERGDLDAAEDYFRRGLAIFTKLAPEGADTANTLGFLGALAIQRGEWDAAETYMRQALAIHQKQGAQARLAECHNNLGAVYQGRGQLAEAEAAYRRALELYRKATSDSLDVAILLRNIGDLAAARGDHAEARARLAESVALARRLAPGSLTLAGSLAALGDASLAEGRTGPALRAYEESLAIRRARAPGSAELAESLYGMGRVFRRHGQRGAARDHWLQAVAALEAQRGRLSRFGQGETAFDARYNQMYRDLIELLVDMGQPRQAFHLLERSRARSFRALLAERDLVLGDVPAELRREQIQAQALYDQVQGRLADLDPVRDVTQADALRAQLEQLRSRRAELAAAMRRASPRLAVLEDPEPLDLDGAARALDPGTLLLSYSVGAKGTLLFAVSAPAAGAAAKPSALDVFRIPVGADALRRRVELLRALIAGGQGASDVDPALLVQARRLFDDLLGPAQRPIAASRRLLLVPDGPLHALPFAALVTADHPVRYLAEVKPVHVAASVTVYDQLKKRRRPAAAPAGPVLVAFGAPDTGDGPDRRGAGSDTVAVAARARRLAGLPASRTEVEAVTALYPGRAVSYLGAQATEERVQALGPGPRLIHFASHALVDERFPLDSALVLAPSRPGQAGGNGLLQAWEVVERVRIDADLVTLSACETGLGREVGGEGLIGLSRAFQYAGARSVLASLWSVSDRSTAELMGRFYAALLRGMAKDEALQAAQMEMRHSAAHAHPFHWAAFQLSGPWN